MKNTMFYTVAINFLVAVMSTMTNQLQIDLASAIPQVVLQDQVLEIKKEISGNKPTLLSSTTDRADGICSFDQGGRLEVGRAFVFDEVSFGYATNAASGKAGELEYNTKAPKELQNALVVISQEGREVLRKPFRDLHNIQTGEKASDEYTTLKGLGYFQDGKKVTIDLILPEGVTLDPAVKHYVYFRASGLQTAKKA